MGLIVITPPAVEPVTLELARQQVRADGTDQDALLTRYIRTARAQCEGIIQRPLIRRTYRQSLDGFPVSEGSDLLLLADPVSSVSTVSYTDEAGDDQVMAGDAYTFDSTGGESWLFPALGTSWPATQAVINAVRVDFVAGLAADADGVPDDAVGWMLLAIGALWENRSAIDLTGRANQLPGDFQRAMLWGLINDGRSRA